MKKDEIFKYLASGDPKRRCYAVTFQYEEGIPIAELYSAIEAALKEVVIGEKEITDPSDIEFVNRALYKLTNLLIPSESSEQRSFLVRLLSLLDVVELRFGKEGCPGTQYARHRLEGQ